MRQAKRSGFGTVSVVLGVLAAVTATVAVTTAFWADPNADPDMVALFTWIIAGIASLVMTVTGLVFGVMGILRDQGLWPKLGTGISALLLLLFCAWLIAIA